MITTSPCAPPQPASSSHGIQAIGRIPARVRRGRPGVLTLRALAALVLAEAVLHSGAGLAPDAGTLTGVATWLALAARGDLAPPRGGDR